MTAPRPGIIVAPFTADQVDKLNAWQAYPWVHPFTCGRCRDADPRWPSPDEHALVAAEAGWVCPTCDYTQDWAHVFMAETLPEPPWSR